MTEKQATSSKKQQANRRSKIVASYLYKPQKGFTIIESLVALLVVSILLAAIAPVITLSVATRLQSRRVELATQAAKSYIDGVRTQKIVSPVTTGSTSTPIYQYGAPTATGSLTCTANSYCTVPTGTSLFCVDFDGTDACEATSPIDMIVQAFRSQNASTTTTGYVLGVRVYRSDAFKLSTTLSRNNATGNGEKVTQKSFTGGAGKRTLPLVEMTTDINDIVPKYNDLCTRFPGGCIN
ncbi:hormogonium polysaccharide secretion pseudopilin HpsB [Scytonema hofmannii]|uniref:hormogonium polysaccharide secretion pseudopilin HpsB n=1 Tax=Scytonema hofmannii TaxID=34078 RepID=UPI000380D5EE